MAVSHLDISIDLLSEIFKGLNEEGGEIRYYRVKNPLPADTKVISSVMVEEGLIRVFLQSEKFIEGGEPLQILLESVKISSE